MDEPLIQSKDTSVITPNTFSIFRYVYRFTFEPALLKKTQNAFNERYLALIKYHQLDENTYLDDKLLETIRKTFKSILITRPQIVEKTNKSSNFSTLLGQSLAHHWVALIYDMNPNIQFQQEPNAWILPMPSNHWILTNAFDRQTIQDKFKSHVWTDQIIQIEYKINDAIHDFTLQM